MGTAEPRNRRARGWGPLSGIVCMTASAPPAAGLTSAVTVPETLRIRIPGMCLKSVAAQTGGLQKRVDGRSVVRFCLGSRCFWIWAGKHHTRLRISSTVCRQAYVMRKILYLEPMYPTGVRGCRPRTAQTCRPDPKTPRSETKP